MYYWTNVEASRLRRADLLEEAETRHLTLNLRQRPARRRLLVLPHTFWWEIQRNLQRVSKRIHANHGRADA